MQRYKGICNDYQERKSVKSVARQTTQDRINCGIKIKICSAMLLHSKERQFTTAGSEL